MHTIAYCPATPAQLEQPDAIGLVLNAEIRDASCCTKAWLLCKCCAVFDQSRSYLYVRENSVESNVAYSLCCGLLTPAPPSPLEDWAGLKMSSPSPSPSPATCQYDDVSVAYFDRGSYQPWNQCLFCLPTDPTVQAAKFGCNLCCVPLECTCVQCACTSTWSTW